MTKKEKLIRVEFYYDSGEIHYLEGEELEKWKKAANSAIMMSDVRGHPNPLKGIEFKRKEEK